MDSYDRFTGDSPLGFAMLDGDPYKTTLYELCRWSVYKKYIEHHSAGVGLLRRIFGYTDLFMMKNVVTDPSRMKAFERAVFITEHLRRQLEGAFEYNLEHRGLREARHVLNYLIQEKTWLWYGLRTPLFDPAEDLSLVGWRDKYLGKKERRKQFFTKQQQEITRQEDLELI